MEGDDVGTAVRERVDIAFRLRYHHVDVKDQIRSGTDAFDHRHAQGDLRHEHAVHDIDVGITGTGPGGFRHVSGQIAEIS